MDVRIGLLPSQRGALAHVEGFASGGPLGTDLAITLNFHPDRSFRGGLVISALAEDGVYCSQFVTGTSNGGLTARPGGDRWLWESRMFGGAYDSADPRERPVYGALDHRRDGSGGARRFGSSYFRLAPEVLGRATFCYPDSSALPTRFGTADRCDLVERALAGGLDLLDEHVEAHVHGPVRLDRDVAALVLDPSYRDTEVEAVARLLPCPVEWHAGFRLDVGELRRHPDYRGPRYVELGAEIARDGLLDPRAVGDASRTGRHDPQALKKVWHCLARFGFGRPRPPR